MGMEQKLEGGSVKFVAQTPKHEEEMTQSVIKGKKYIQ